MWRMNVYGLSKSSEMQTGFVTCAYKPPDMDTSKLIDGLTGSFSLVNQDKFDNYVFIS